MGTKAYPDLIGHSQKLFETLRFRVDIEEVNHQDERVLVFEIPSRPTGTAYHLEGAYLMRSGGSLLPMSEYPLRRVFAEGRPDWVEEHTKSGLDAQEIVDLIDTQTFFELLKLPYPTDQAGVIERLERERLIDFSGGAICNSPHWRTPSRKTFRRFPRIGA